MKKKHMSCISAAMAALMFIACKPTENNYQAAYDAAVAKRQEVAKEQMRPTTGLMSDDGPQLRIVNGDSIYVLREMVRMLDGERVSARWLVAVGVYKMDTNAKASVMALHSEGFPDAFVAKASGGRHYAVAAVTTSLDSARVVSKKFRSTFPEYPYVGLPGAPVLVNN